MAEDPRTLADHRLEAALPGSGIRDPRPFYRPLLKHLRERDPPAFDRAIRYFEDTLVPAVAGGADPMAAWLDYGRLLSEQAGPGRMVAVDAEGRARTGEATSPGLVLFIPGDVAAPVLVLRCPAETTAAQDATIELLVLGRTSASAYQ